MILVMYHAENNKIRLYKNHEPYEYWFGEPYVPWKSLEISLMYGWEVVGEL